MKFKLESLAGQSLVFGKGKTIKVDDKGFVETDDKDISEALKVVGFKAIVPVAGFKKTKPVIEEKDLKKRKPKKVEQK